MSLLTQISAVNNNINLWLSAIPSTITVNRLNAKSISVSTINAYDTHSELATVSTLFFQSTFGENVLADYGEFTELFCYDKFTLDQQVLTADSNDLLLNGIPIATTANLSSIQDWSLFPALSNGVNMATYDIINGGTANFTGLDKVVMGSIKILNSSNIINSNSITTATAETTGAATVGTVLNFRNLNQTGTVPYTNTFTTLTNFQASVAGTSFTASNSLLSPLLSNTGDMTVRSQRNLQLYGCNGVTMDSIGTTIITNDVGNNVGLNSLIRLNAKNGNRGRIELTADPGYAYIQGEVALTANAGTNTIAGIAFGGRITLNAGSAGIPSGFNIFYPSYVIQTADSILSYAGGITPITGVYGYNYVQGFNGVNIVAGTGSVIPNVPGTVYLYGTNAAGSGNSGGVRIQNGLSVDTIYPFPTGFVSPPYDLTLKGNAAGNMVSLSNVRDIYGGNTSNQGNIYSMSNINCYNLNTTNINGSPYGGGSSGTWVSTATSDLNMNGYNISSIQALNINSGSQVRMGTPLAYVRAGYTSGLATSSINMYAKASIIASADGEIRFTDTKQLTLAGSNVDIAANNTLELYTANQGLSIYSLNGGVSTFAPNVSVVGSNSVGISGSNINLLASSNINITAPVVALSNVSSINGVAYTGGGSGWVGTAASDLDMNGYSIITPVGSNLTIGNPTAPQIDLLTIASKYLQINQSEVGGYFDVLYGVSEIYADTTQVFMNGSNVHIQSDGGYAYLDITNNILLSNSVGDITITGSNVTLSNVTSINGSSYPPAAGWVGVATSPLDMNGYVITDLTQNLTLSTIGSINLNCYEPPVPISPTPFAVDQPFPEPGGGRYIYITNTSVSLSWDNVRIENSHGYVYINDSFDPTESRQFVVDDSIVAGWYRVTITIGDEITVGQINALGFPLVITSVTSTGTAAYEWGQGATALPAQGKININGYETNITGISSINFYGKIVEHNQLDMNGFNIIAANSVEATTITNNPIGGSNIGITATGNVNISSTTVNVRAPNINLYGNVGVNGYITMLGNTFYTGGGSIYTNNGYIFENGGTYFYYGGNINSSRTSGVNYLDINAPPTTGSGTGQLRLLGNKGSLIFDDNVALSAPSNAINLTSPNINIYGNTGVIGTLYMNSNNIEQIRSLYFQTTGNIITQQVAGVNYLDINAPNTTGSGTGQLRFFGNKGNMIFDDNITIGGNGSNQVGLYNQYGYIYLDDYQNVYLGGGGSHRGREDNIIVHGLLNSDSRIYTGTSGVGFLHQNGSGFIQTRVDAGAYGGLSMNGYFQVCQTGTTSAIFTVPSDNNQSAWYSNGTGGFGIGTTTPAYKLDVAGKSCIDNALIGRWSSYGSTYAGFQHLAVVADTTAYALLQQNNGATFLNSASGQSISFNVGANNYMTLASSGNFGIGTTTPAYKLDVNGTAHVSGGFYRDLGSTAIAQPVLQYGTTTGSGTSGSVTVSIPTAYTSASSYVAFAAMEDSTEAKIAVNRDSASQITIVWSQGGSGSHTLAWNTMGT
jgi:hypothetical protein